LGDGLPRGITKVYHYSTTVGPRMLGFAMTCFPPSRIAARAGAHRQQPRTGNLRIR
jgi:hypothetical protein